MSNDADDGQERPAISWLAKKVVSQSLEGELIQKEYTELLLKSSVGSTLCNMLGSFDNEAARLVYMNQTFTKKTYIINGVFTDAYAVRPRWDPWRSLLGVGVR